MEKNKKITVILPCAGEGSRLSLPYPKEIFSIEKGKSLIDYSFDLFRNKSRDEVSFVIVINENKTALVKYLSKYKSNFEISFTYFNPSESEYTGSIKSCRHLFGENNLVLLPDTILKLKDEKDILKLTLENLEKSEFTFFVKKEQSFDMLKTKGALFVSEDNVVCKYEDKPNQGLSNFNAFWCAFAFKKEVFDICMRYMENSTLKNSTSSLKIEDTPIFNSTVIEVEDYVDLGTWDEIYRKINKIS